MPGRLTTHVLDTARGRPAAGIKINLYRLEGDDRTLIGTFCTNTDGRTNEPLLRDEAFTAGVYELVFAVGAYFADVADPPFLDRVPLRFGIADPERHYHVPLLFSPWAYSTYRGS